MKRSQDVDLYGEKRDKRADLFFMFLGLVVSSPRAGLPSSAL
jgi:hypothetical protein